MNLEELWDIDLLGEPLLLVSRAILHLFSRMNSDNNCFASPRGDLVELTIFFVLHCFLIDVCLDGCISQPSKICSSVVHTYQTILLELVYPAFQTSKLGGETSKTSTRVAMLEKGPQQAKYFYIQTSPILVTPCHQRSSNSSMPATEEHFSFPEGHFITGISRQQLQTSICPSLSPIPH